METTTVAFAGTHVSVLSGKPYEQVIRAIESVLGEGDAKSFARIVESSSSWEEFARETERSVGQSGFVIFAEIDHGAWMSLLASHHMKGRLYVIGNPLIARRMLEHVPEIGLYVPVRVYVYEDERGAARVDYDRLAPIFERFGSEEVNEVARMLDGKLEELMTEAAR